MSYNSSISMFERISNSKPSPNYSTVTSGPFQGLAKAMLSSAEAMSYVLIKQVQDLENRGRLDIQMRFWLWRNFRISIFKIVESFTEIARTNKDLFLEAIHEEGIETVIAMFIWTADPTDRDVYDMVELFLDVMSDSETGETRYPIDYQKVYRMFHYLVDTFGVQILRDGCDPKISARIYEAIEEYMSSMYEMKGRQASYNYSLEEVNNFITSKFKSETFEWKYNFIHTVFLDLFSK